MSEPNGPEPVETAPVTGTEPSDTGDLIDPDADDPTPPDVVSQDDPNMVFAAELGGHADDEDGPDSTDLGQYAPPDVAP